MDPDPDPEPDPANLTKSGPEPDPAKILDPVDLYIWHIVPYVAHVILHR